MPIALITGGTRGLGRALVDHLTDESWTVVFDARRTADVDATVAALQDGRPGTAIGVPGDVSDPAHRNDLLESIGDRELDLLVNNAGSLGPTPLPGMIDLDVDAFADLLTVNSIAPLALFRAVHERLQRAQGAVVNITSDAAVEPYAGWGGYGASKAALDHVSKVLAVEHPDLAIYSFDPGDMRTDMHQAAFSGEDISDRPTPERVIPGLMRLVERRPPSGRFTIGDLAARPALG
jgi:NAD(P)-dependent dehydrogenase (short-subunit alcohol dehydrogenase family)